MELYRTELSDHFTNIFIREAGLTDAEFERLLTLFRREYVPRKYFYLRAGQVTRQRAYINNGSCRVFTIDEKGNEHILFFAFENWWIGDLESYYTGEPGKLYVQATEDCELLCISKTDFEKLKAEIPSLEAWHHEKQRRSHFATLQRLNEVKSLSPEERYLKLLDQHPHIFQRIPLQYIAAYLDIEPPSLSRLRKRLSGKG